MLYAHLRLPSGLDSVPQNIVTAINPIDHARIRKLLSHSFTEKSLRSQNPIIEFYADLLVTRLRELTTVSLNEDGGTVVDIMIWLNFYTVDVIGDLSFGESFDCLKNGENNPWIRTLDRFLKGMVFVIATRFYPFIESILFQMLPKNIMVMQKKHTAVACEKVHRRLNLEKDRPDFIGSLMKFNADFQFMSLGEIESTITILIIAGYETTSTALAGIINTLVQNPHVLQKLASEIRTSFANEEHITCASVKDLQYLDAVINEGLRLYNPAPAGLQRIVPEGGDTFAGNWIPGGVSYGASFMPFQLSSLETV